VNNICLTALLLLLLRHGVCVCGCRAGFGLRVPPDEHLLVQPNWRINVAAHQQGRGGGGMQ
jgi:hypothetical protein